MSSNGTIKESDEMNNPLSMVDPAILEDMTEQEKKEFEAELLEVKKREDEVTRKLQEQCQREMQDRLLSINQQFDKNVEGVEFQLQDANHRYRDHAEQQIHHKQTDILRANKAIREVSRVLGKDWKPVFSRLMAVFSKEEQEAKIQEVECERPFMQAYKALQIWKECRAEEYNITQLVDALRFCNMYELAEQCLDIIESEGDSLMTIKTIPKLAPNRPPAEDNPPPYNPLDGEKPETEEARSERLRQQAANLTRQSSVQGPLGDAVLLKVARKVVDKWEPLGKSLNVPDEEIAEIKEAETGYQAAFKMLWSFRDSLARQQTGKQDLSDALNKMGLSDVCKLLD